LIAAGRSATAPRIGYRRVISRENQVGWKAEINI
jgi:hypothetical protein